MSHREVPPDNYKKTLNQTGVATRYIDQLARAGIEFSRRRSKPVLEIGCAFGTVTRALLANGNKVIANDLDQGHLDQLRGATPEADQKNLTLLLGAFPDLALSPESLSSVIAIWILHFLSGPKLEVGAQKLFAALEPGGKVFVSVSSPYLKFLSSFIPVFEKNQLDGVPYPGWMGDVSQYLQPHQVQNLPPAMNFLDPKTLAKVFSDAGFRVESSEYFSRADATEAMILDGRENVGLVAAKP